MRNVFEYYDEGAHLAHYGILGQKWGIRRFQNLDRTWTEEGKIRYGSGNGRKFAKKSDPDYTKSKAKKKDESKKFHLSDKQKKYLKIGLTIAGVSLAAYGGYKLYKHLGAKKTISVGKDVVQSYVDKAAGKALSVKKLGRSVSEIDADMVRSINPGYGSGDLGRHINCPHTSTCYILNSLFGEKFTAKSITGIDELSGASLPGRDVHIFDVLFNGIKKTYCAPGSSLVEANKSIQPGSTGVLMLRHKVGFGHVLNYEKDLFGNLTIIDGQDGTITPLSFGFNFADYKCEQILDFSNADINDDALDLFTHFVERL